MATRGKITDLFDVANIEAQQAKVISLIDSYVKEVNDANAKIGQPGGKPSEVIANIERVTTAQTRQNTVTRQAVEEVTKLDLAKKRLAVSSSKEAKDIAFVNAQISENNRQNAMNAKSQNAVAGSLEAASIKVQKLRYELSILADIEGKGAVKANELRAAIDEQNTFIARNSDSLAQAKINIGNYNGAIGKLGKSISGLGKLTSILGSTIGIDPRIVDGIRTVGQSLGALQKVKNVEKLIDIDRGVVTKANTAITVANTAATETNAVAVKGSSIAKKGDVAATGAQTAAQRIYNFVVGESVGATKALRIALASTGVLLLLAGLVAAGVAIYKYATSAKDAITTQKTLNKAFEDSNYKEAVKNVKELTTYIDLAKQGFLSKGDVLDEYNKRLGSTIGFAKDLDEAEQLLVKNGDAYIKITLLKAAANIALNDAAQLAVELAKDEANKGVVDKKQDEEKYRRIIQQSDAYKQLNQKVNEGYAISIIEGNKASRTLEAFYQQQLTFLIGGKKAQNKKTLEDIAGDFQKNAALLAGKFGIDLFGNKDDKTGGTNKSKQSAADFANDLAKIRADISKAEFEALKQRRQDEIDASAAIISDKEKSYAERFKATQNFYNNSKELIDLNTEYEIAAAKKASEEEKKKYPADKERSALLDKKLASDINKINVKAASDKVKIAIDSTGKIKAIEADAIKDREALEKAHIDHAVSVEDTKLKTITNKYDNELVALEEKYTKEQIINKGNKKKLEKAEKEYTKEKIRLQFERDTEILASQIEFAEKQLAILKIIADAETDPIKKRANLDALKKAEQELIALKIKLGGRVAENNKILNEQTKKLSEEAKNKIISDFEEIREKAQQIFEVIGGLIAAGVTKELNIIQEQIDLLELKKQKDIEVANQSIANAQDRAAAITVIEARANAQREQLEIKKRQAQERQARFEKAAAIANIILNTAVSVAKVLGNPFQVAFALALGALQLAVAIATPIPKYKHGTGNRPHPGGPAIVGEGTTAELIDIPGKGMFVADKPTFIPNLPKGSEVFPDINKVAAHVLQDQMIRTMNVINGRSAVVSDSTAMAVGRMEQSVVGAIKKIPQQRIVVDNIISKRIQSSGGYTNYINRNVG